MHEKLQKLGNHLVQQWCLWLVCKCLVGVSEGLSPQNVDGTNPA